MTDASGEAEEPAWKQLHPLLEVPSRPDSMATLQFASECILRCLHGHRKCQISPTFVPKRLVKMTPTGGQVVSIDEAVPYIALSYCWGPRLPLKTLKANLDQHKDHIDIDLVPQCFKDVWKLAPKLGIDHLWVDSLCIIQDDHSE